MRYLFFGQWRSGNFLWRSALILIVWSLLALQAMFHLRRWLFPARGVSQLGLLPLLFPTLQVVRGRGGGLGMHLVLLSRGASSPPAGSRSSERGGSASGLLSVAREHALASLAPLGAGKGRVARSSSGGFDWREVSQVAVSFACAFFSSAGKYYRSSSVFRGYGPGFLPPTSGRSFIGGASAWFCPLLRLTAVSLACGLAFAVFCGSGGFPRGYWWSPVFLFFGWGGWRRLLYPWCLLHRSVFRSIMAYSRLYFGCVSRGLVQVFSCLALSVSVGVRSDLALTGSPHFGFV